MNTASVLDPALGVILTRIVSPLVWLLFAAALLYFLFGVVRYLWSADSSDSRDTGRKHMLYGLIGMAIMLSVFGIMKFIFGVVTDSGTEQGIDGKVVPVPSIIERESF